MMKSNILQVFTQASLHLGVSSADELAQSIKEHDLTRFLPICNTGINTDIMAQEQAARKHNLQPRYGRTFFFKNDPQNIESSTPFRLAPVTIYAKTLDGRDWLYQQHEQYLRRHELLGALQKAPTGSLLIFLPDIWLTNQNANDDAISIRELHPDSTYIAVNEVVGALSSPNERQSWAVVTHRPICAASEKEEASLGAVHKTNGLHRFAPYLSFSPQNTTNPNFFNGRHFRSKIRQLVASHTETTYTSESSSISMEELFSQCKQLPTLDEIFFQIEQERRQLSLKRNSALRKALECCYDTFALREPDIDLLPRYRKRFEHEMDMIDHDGHAGLIADCLKILSVANRHQIDLCVGGPLTNSFVFHVMGLTCINPIKEELPAELLFESSETPQLHFEIADKNELKKLHQALNMELDGDIICPVKTSNYTASNALKVSMLDRWQFNEQAKLIFGKKGVRDEEALSVAAKSPDTPFKGALENACLLLSQCSHYEQQSKVIFSSSLPHYRYSPSQSGASSMSESELEQLPGSLYRMSHKSHHALRKAILSEERGSLAVLRQPENDVFQFIMNNRFHEAMHNPVVFTKQFKNDSLRNITLNDIANGIAWKWRKQQCVLPDTKDDMSSGDDSSHTIIDELLKDTNGTLLYQEQVFHILSKGLGIPSHRQPGMLRLIKTYDPYEIANLLASHSSRPRELIEQAAQCIAASQGFWYPQGQALSQALYFYEAAALFYYYPTTAAKHHLNKMFSQKRTIGAVEKLSMMREFQQCYNVSFGRFNEQSTFKGLQLTVEDGHLVPKQTMKRLDDEEFKRLIHIFTDNKKR